MKDFVIPVVFYNSYDEIIKKKQSSLSLNVYYKVFEIKYMSKFKIYEYFNYITGFLSLCFGVSLLSLIEIIELIYKLLFWIKYQKSFIRIESKLKQFFSLKIFKSIELIFEKSYLHGIDKLFSTTKSALFKLIWLIVLIMDAGLLYFFTKLAIGDFLKYESYFEKTNQLIENNDYILNRTISFLVCSPLKPRQNFSATYIRLNDKTEELFGNTLTENQDLTHIIETYKKFIIEQTDQNPSHTNYKNASYLYSTIFYNYTIKLITSLNVNEPIFINAKLNYNKMCQYITPNFTIKTTKVSKINYDFYRQVNTYDYNMSLNMLDSKSLYTNKKNEFNIQRPIEYPKDIGFSFLKYEKQLSFPFKSDCNPNLGYFAVRLFFMKLRMIHLRFIVTHSCCH